MVSISASKCHRSRNYLGIWELVRGVGEGKPGIYSLPSNTFEKKLNGRKERNILNNNNKN
jgi:hypothetical protein